MSEITKDADNEDHISSQDYESLLDQYQFSAKEIVQGKIIKGKVIKVTPNHVLVDIGFKSEGIIPKEDIIERMDLKEIRPGDTIEATFERSD